MQTLARPHTDKEIDVTISKQIRDPNESGILHQCNLCDFKCPKEETLKTHTKTRENNPNNEKTNERKFYCHKCCLSFKTKKSFQKHERF